MTDRDIEDILRDYPVIRAQATIKQEHLYNVFPSVTATWSDMPHGQGTTSDSTGNIAVKRATEPLEVKQSRAIEIACEALTKDCRELVKLYYFEKWRRYETMYKLNISEQVFKQYRREALDKIRIILETTTKQPQNNLILTGKS